jgi:hypothetical protein
METEGPREGAMDDAAVLRQQAAETLRTVEGMKRRTAAVGGRASVFPLLAYAFAGFVGAVACVISRTPACVYRHIGPGSDEGTCTTLPNIGVPTAVAISVALVLAVVATEIHYRRQPVHPASPKQQISVPQAIILAALVIVLGPFILGSIFIALSGAAGSLFIFLLISIAAIVQSRHIRNDALARAGALGALSLAAAQFINTDFEGSIVGFCYGAAFLIAAAIVYRRKTVAA